MAQVTPKRGILAILEVKLSFCKCRITAVVSKRGCNSTLWHGIFFIIVSLVLRILGVSRIPVPRGIPHPQICCVLLICNQKELRFASVSDLAFNSNDRLGGHTYLRARQDGATSVSGIVIHLPVGEPTPEKGCQYVECSRAKYFDARVS
jgi:hypothetical protein